MPQYNECLWDGTTAGSAVPSTRTAFNGTGIYPIAFPYQHEEDVLVYLENPENTFALQATNTYAFGVNAQNQNTISFTTAPTAGWVWLVRKTELCENEVEFEPGASIRAEDLNDTFTQMRNAIIENREYIRKIEGGGDIIDPSPSRLVGGDGIEITTAATEQTIAVDLANQSGLEFSNNELRVDTHQGLERTANGLSADLGNGLQFDGNNQIEARIGNGLTTSGTTTIVDQGAGLEFNGNELRVNIDKTAATTGLQFAGDSLQVKPATTTERGGIRVGNTLTITSGDILNVSAQVTGGVTFKGTIDLRAAPGEPTSPEIKRGDLYINSNGTSGNPSADWANLVEGLAAGDTVDAGDLIIAKADSGSDGTSLGANGWSYIPVGAQTLWETNAQAGGPLDGTVLRPKTSTHHTWMQATAGVGGTQPSPNIVLNSTGQIDVIKDSGDAHNVVLNLDNPTPRGTPGSLFIDFNLANSNANDPKAAIGVVENSNDGYANIVFQTSPGSNSSVLEEHCRITETGQFLVNTVSEIISGSATNIQSIDDSGARIALGRSEHDINNNAVLGRIGFAGNHGTNWSESGAVECAADTDHTDAARPSKLRFFVRGDSGNSVEKMRINKTGKITSTVDHNNGAVADALRLSTAGTYSNANSLQAGPGITFGQFDASYPTWTLAQVAAIRTGATWGGDLVFYVNKDSASASSNLSEGMRVRSDGNVSINDGNLAFANGHGIDFSAKTPSAGGSTVALLDDYEEGTWQPTVGRVSAPPTVAYTSNQGFYTKVGRKCTVWGYINVNTISDGAGDFLINGLPFKASDNANESTSGGQASAAFGRYENMAGPANIVGYLGETGNNTSINIWWLTRDASNDLQRSAVTSWNNGSSIRFTLTYLVD